MIKILIGLLVLSVMVFIHELGHFIVAKLCGVVVQSFSIGWGPVLLRKKIGETEYRLSLIPMGGYCGMKGENAFRTAVEQKLKSIPSEDGGLYNASPFKRMLIAFAGPFANYISAVFCFAIISSLGSTYYTPGNKIVPVHLYEKDTNTSAKVAGLETGDVILEIEGKKIATFRDLMQAVIASADIPLSFKIERNGQILTKKITPFLNKKTGAGVIGVYPYTPLKIEKVVQGSALQNAGILEGDVITKIDGKDVSHTIDLQHELLSIAKTEKDEMSIEVLRDGESVNSKVRIVRTDDGFLDFPITFETIKVVEKGSNFWKSIVAGFVQTHETIKLTFRGFAMLFKGIELKNAVSGPLRITHMIGDVAQEGFKVSAGEGWRGILYFVSIISISLFIMNLLPVPVLDGGLILLSFIEGIMRRNISPIVTYRVQFIGFAFIACLFVVALVADVFFFIS